MLSTEVAAEDCAPHPDGLQGRCRFCGSPEGSDHDPGCRVYTQNPLRGAGSPQEPAPAQDAPGSVEDEGVAVDDGSAAEMAAPVSLSEREVKVLVPSLTAKVRLVLLGERIYLRDDGEFRLLGSGPDLDVLRGAQLKLAESRLLAAACDYWRKVDEITGVANVTPVREQLGGLGELREVEQAAWEDYRELLES